MSATDQRSIFALELAEERPDATIIALDIASDQFPPARICPSNVKFGTWNIFDPVPDEYISRFDVVHLRLIVAATINKDKFVVINNLMKLLSKLPVARIINRS